MKTKIKDLYAFEAGAGGLANGPFTYLLSSAAPEDISTEEYTSRWGVDYGRLNLLYMMRSSEKKLSVFYDQNFGADIHAGKTAKILLCNQMIATSIDRLFREKWLALWDALAEEYNPIENYNMLEIMEDDETVHEKGTTVTTTNNLSHTKTGTETEQRNLSDTLTISGSETDALTKTGTETDTLVKTGSEKDALTKTGTETDTLVKSGSETDTLVKTGTETETRQPNLSTGTTENVYAFNSNAAVPTSSASGTETGSETNAKTYTNRQDQDTKSFTNRKDETVRTFNNRTDKTDYTGTDTMTYNTTDMNTGTSANAATGSDTDTRNYRLTRSGNIGVTTTQQMISQEWELRKNLYFDMVLSDIDTVLTLSVY